MHMLTGSLVRRLHFTLVLDLLTLSKELFPSKDLADFVVDSVSKGFTF